MPDHTHPGPPCGFPPNVHHHPSCNRPDMGSLVACGEIWDPDNPSDRKLICRHRKRQPHKPHGKKTASKPAKKARKAQRRAR